MFNRFILSYDKAVHVDINKICMKVIYICWYAAAHIGRLSRLDSQGRKLFSGQYCNLYHIILIGPQDGEIRIGKRGSERGVIGVHALCIISYSEEDSAASGNESGQQCAEVYAANANEGAAFAGRYIWLKARVMVNTAQRCYQRKSKGRRVEKRWVFEGFVVWLKIKDLIGDKRAESLM